jgi:hypothetical protein
LTFALENLVWNFSLYVIRKLSVDHGLALMGLLFLTSGIVYPFSTIEYEYKAFQKYDFSTDSGVVSNSESTPNGLHYSRCCKGMKHFNRSILWKYACQLGWECPGLVVPTFSFFRDTLGTFAGHGLGHPGHVLKKGCFWRSKMRTRDTKIRAFGTRVKTCDIMV